MKDGGIVEMGTHTELMQIKGEYAKLYNIQASAFQDPVRVEVRCPSFQMKSSLKSNAKKTT